MMLEGLRARCTSVASPCRNCSASHTCIGVLSTVTAQVPEISRSGEEEYVAPFLHFLKDHQVRTDLQ